MSFKKIVIGVIVVIVFFIVVTKISDYEHKGFCKDFKTRGFRGLIINKYIDKKEHNYKMLVIQNNDIRDSLSFSNDLSGFYDYIHINDTIDKIENSNEIRIFNRDTSFIINFNCD